MPKAVEFESYLVEATLLKDKIKNFDEYPFSIPAFKDLEVLEFHPQVTFFVGENGSGKSTLMEAIAVGLGINAEGGRRNFRFATRESHSNLSAALRLSRSHRKPKDLYFLWTESFFNVATEDGFELYSNTTRQRLERSETNSFGISESERPFGVLSK